MFGAGLSSIQVFTKYDSRLLFVISQDELDAAT